MKKLSMLAGIFRELSAKLEEADPNYVMVMGYVAEDGDSARVTELLIPKHVRSTPQDFEVSADEMVRQSFDDAAQPDGQQRVASQRFFAFNAPNGFDLRCIGGGMRSMLIAKSDRGGIYLLVRQRGGVRVFFAKFGEPQMDCQLDVRP